MELVVQGSRIRVSRGFGQSGPAARQTRVRTGIDPAVGEKVDQFPVGGGPEQPRKKTVGVGTEARRFMECGRV
ncbi:MAG: hypothetical protein ACNS61_14630 [Candidatus Wenzhouxiangella sp. M2_3B_020]